MEQKAATAGYTESMHLANTLNPSTLSEIVRGWLKEDTPSFDLGGFVVGDKPETAALLCKSPGVLAGLPFVEAVFAELGCSVQWLRAEGTWLDPVTRVVVAWVRGPARRVLLGERVALNTLARVSGIATTARRMQTMARVAGWHGQIAGTRKTTPGFRLAEKYGLLVAGVDTHRYDLSSMVMLKDNHIWSAGNITKAVQAARQVAGFSTKIEVECRSVAEALEAAGAGADIVMLDNFSPQTIHEAAQQVKDQHTSIMIEASGGISESTLLQYLGPNIDIISMGSLTQGYSIVDFSLKITKDGNVPGIQHVS